MYRRRQWHPTPVLLPGKSHGRRSLVGCSPWGLEESDTTERLHFDFSVSCIGEGNGNPFQHSCLENPRNRGAWWAAIYGVAQSRTWLKRLSSSSSNVRSHVQLCMTPRTMQAVEFPRLSLILEWVAIPFSPPHFHDRPGGRGTHQCPQRCEPTHVFNHLSVPNCQPQVHCINVCVHVYL